MSKDIADIWKDSWETEQKIAITSRGKFRVQPVSAEIFTREWVGNSLFEAQLEIIQAAFNKDYTDITVDYREFVLALGKGSGKDFSIAILITYIIYWLTCLNNPHEYLGIKEDENIDIVNIALDADQANSVFFDKFKACIKKTIDPATGKNYFTELGMDLDRAILKKSVVFPFNIRAWSSNSREEKSEGKNILFAIFDEIGGFRFDKAKSLRDHIKSSAKTRFPKFYKLFYISFLRDANDYMAYLLEQAEDNKMPYTYYMRKATWEVRSKDTKYPDLVKYAIYREDFQDAYDEDEGEAQLKYECKIPTVRRNNFIKNPKKILQCIGGHTDKEGNFVYRPSPIVDYDEWMTVRIDGEDTKVKKCWTTNLLEEEFEPWFRPYMIYEMYRLTKEYEEDPSDDIEDKIKMLKERHANAIYHLHIDLSRGVEDSLGLILGHSYYILDNIKCYFDLEIQMRAAKTNEDNQEIDMTEVLKFITDVLIKKLKFPITKVTADGYQSALFLDTFKNLGIETEYLSLKNEQYETGKEVIYRGDVDMYYHPTLIRELTELIRDEKGRVDHPPRSKWRMKEEGKPKGSNDLSDCGVGVIFIIMSGEIKNKLKFGSNLKKVNKKRHSHLNRTKRIRGIREDLDVK